MAFAMNDEYLNVSILHLFSLVPRVDHVDPSISSALKHNTISIPAHMKNIISILWQTKPGDLEIIVIRCIKSVIYSFD